MAKRGHVTSAPYLSSKDQKTYTTLLAFYGGFSKNLHLKFALLTILLSFFLCIPVEANWWHATQKIKIPEPHSKHLNHKESHKNEPEVSFEDTATKILKENHRPGEMSIYFALDRDHVKYYKDDDNKGIIDVSNSKFSLEGTLKQYINTDGKKTSIYINENLLKDDNFQSIHFEDNVIAQLGSKREPRGESAFWIA